MKKFLKIFIKVVLAIFIFVGMILGYSLLPIKNNFKIYSVHSGSMGETISVGSIIIVEPQSIYKIDDIVTYSSSTKKRKGETITHRIIEKKMEHGRESYTTKGDANEDPDQEMVIEEKIIGKVTHHIKYLGYPVGYIKTPVGLILLILVPAFIIISEEIKKIKEEYKKIKHKT